MLALAAACAIFVVGAVGTAEAQVPGLPQLPGLPGLPADTPVQPYGTNDGGGFWNILPPGQNGHASGADIGAFFAACPPPKTNCPSAPRPKHSSKELQMYGDLVYASPGLRAADIPKYFKDATFGVKQNEAERIYSPPGRDDVTSGVWAEVPLRLAGGLWELTPGVRADLYTSGGAKARPVRQRLTTVTLSKIAVAS